MYGKNLAEWVHNWESILIICNSQENLKQVFFLFNLRTAQSKYETIIDNKTH